MLVIIEKIFSLIHKFGGYNYNEDDVPYKTLISYRMVKCESSVYISVYSSCKCETKALITERFSYN